MLLFVQSIIYTFVYVCVCVCVCERERESTYVYKPFDSILLHNSLDHRRCMKRLLFHS
jgi:hypothetical protein